MEKFDNTADGKAESAENNTPNYDRAERGPYRENDRKPKKKDSNIAVKGCNTEK